MAAIPTILKGDDTGEINLTLDNTHTYTGATLVVAYQGVTKNYTNLVAGGTVHVKFTHDETAGFSLGCFPLLAQLVGATGGVETLSNAEWRIKTSDIVAEVNAGGSFMVAPGSADIPVTDLGDLPARYTQAQLVAKVNAIVATLAQRTAVPLLLLAALLGVQANGASAQKARLDALYNDALVVTNVDFDASGLSRDDVREEIEKAVGPTNTVLHAETDPTVPAWAKNPTPPVTTETDPTVPSWAKATNPPAETDPTVPAWAKAANPPATYTDADAGRVATNVVRAANGGVWDAALQVWWTPVMSSGKLTYQATTNINLNANN